MGNLSSGQLESVTIADIPSCDSSSSNLEATISSEAMERAQREMEELFRYANVEHPAMQTLRQLCTARRARQLSRKI